ncbi:MAG: hypothetical protein Q9M08_03985 [Mariprofundus sp.]|nr:hypothetical protein [Mariprofundus sp.]
MIILPVSTPAVAIDQNSVNQSQQNQVNQSEQSRKATDTVMVSPEARQMASADSNYSASSNNTPAAPQQAAASSEPVTAQQAAASTAPPAPQQIADIEVAEKVADSEVVEQQRPTNAMTGKQDSTKIDVVA